jgi:hypothetical protein
MGLWILHKDIFSHSYTTYMVKWYEIGKDMKWAHVMAAHLHVNDSVRTIALTWQQNKITMEVASIQSRDGKAIPISCNTERILHPQVGNGGGGEHCHLILRFLWRAPDAQFQSSGFTNAASWSCTGTRAHLTSSAQTVAKPQKPKLTEHGIATTLILNYIMTMLRLYQDRNKNQTRNKSIY